MALNLELVGSKIRRYREQLELSLQELAAMSWLVLFRHASPKWMSRSAMDHELVEIVKVRNCRRTRRSLSAILDRASRGAL